MLYFAPMGHFLFRVETVDEDCPSVMHVKGGIMEASGSSLLAAWLSINLVRPGWKWHLGRDNGWWEAFQVRRSLPVRGRLVANPQPRATVASDERRGGNPGKLWALGVAAASADTPSARLPRVLLGE